MINMLLNASVAGGIVILLWYLTYPLSRKHFMVSWHYALLKIIIVFMLFDKARERLMEQQARIKELETKRTELENMEIVDIVRGLSIPLDDLSAFLQSLKGGGFPPFQLRVKLTRSPRNPK